MNDFEIIGALSAEQREIVYRSEVARLKRDAPLVPRIAIVYLAVYILGCLLIYFGVVGCLVEVWASHGTVWKLVPDYTFFDDLIEGVRQVIRPFLAVLLSGFLIGVPLSLPFGIWYWVGDIVRQSKER